MEFHREPPVWRGDENAFSAHPPSFAEEPKLIFPAADMFEYGARMHVVERAVAKREVAAIAAQKSQSRIGALQERGVVHTDRRHFPFMRIPSLEIIRMSVAAVGGSADIENRIGVRGPGKIEVGAKHLASLIGRKPGRYTGGGGQRVLRPVRAARRQITQGGATPPRPLRIGERTRNLP